ncbi:MAG: hypothetical protein F6K08_05115 [Okeania sp. SIO1H6]|nr:hypothetical protein [Okeania sp. SIO1H6]
MYKSIKCIGIERSIEKMFDNNFNSIDWEIKYLRVIEEKNHYIISIDCKIAYSFVNLLRIFILKQINIFRLPIISFELKFPKDKSTDSIASNIYNNISINLNSVSINNIEEVYTLVYKKRSIHVSTEENI